jgi:DNA-binding NtrC family response regulator
MEIQVFVIDDDLDDLQLMQEYFAEVKLEATFYSDAQHLIAAIKPDVPCVVVSDYDLKGSGTGVQVMKSVMQIQNVIAPVFVSGATNVPQLLDIIRLRVGSYYVKKSPDVNWFRQVIEKVYQAKIDMERKIMKAHVLGEKDRELKEAAKRILERLEKK